MSKKPKQLYIIGGGITTGEAERIKDLFGAQEVKWLSNGDSHALQVATSSNNKTFLLEKGHHHLGVLKLQNHEWHVFHKEGHQIVVSRKVPGKVEFAEALRIGRVAPVST